MSIHLLMPSLSRYISQEASDSRHLLSPLLSPLLSNGKLKLTLAFQKPKYLDLPPREKQAREDSAMFEICELASFSKDSIII